MVMRQFCILAGIAMALSGPALAQEIKPAEAAKMRQGVMTAVKWQFAPIGAVVKGERPFDTDVVGRAQNLAALFKVAGQGFAVPSGPDAVPGTKTKPAVWQEQMAFTALMGKAVTESERLVIAAQSRDPNQLKAQFLAVSGVCKDCHEKFRAE